MPRHSATPHPWQVTLIFTVFGIAVTAAAAAGWWYARESTPHQGPIVLVSIEGLRPAELQAYGRTGGHQPAIDALSADAIVFERAYAHSPLTLPAHASILAGQLPFEHGVRDEAGFALADETRSLPELLQNRGFETGAAVSSFLLRPASGLAQGFSFFNAELPEAPDAEGPIVERDGTRTAEAAEDWLRGRRGHRFFLFVQVGEAAAEPALSRLVGQLKERELYDRATIMLTADHAGTGAGLSSVSVDEASLHVPLLVKQPGSEGAGRRIALPVQHIDILPTVLDLVRAPIPPGLRGRSLRAVLDGDDTGIENPSVYAESLAALFRYGGAGRFLLASSEQWYVRLGHGEHKGIERSSTTGAVPEQDEAVRLRIELDRLLEAHGVSPPAEIDAAEEDRFAVLGYLGGGQVTAPDPEPLDPAEEAWVLGAHRAAAVLAGEKRYIPAIGLLRDISRAHPRLAAVQYQLGTLLGRVRRREEAERAFRAAARIAPDSPYVPIALAALLLRAQRPADAREHAALAVALAEHHDSRSRAAAHQVAARVALALEDADDAEQHADAAEREDPEVPMRQFVRGRLLAAEGRHEEARTAFEAAAAVLDRHGRALEELHVSLGEMLMRIEDSEGAEQQFRQELHAFPRSIRTYSNLALLYRASKRTSDVQETLDALVEATRTPDGYDTAARLWTMFGEPARAAAVRADARAWFRGEKPASRLSTRSDAW